MNKLLPIQRFDLRMSHAWLVLNFWTNLKLAVLIEMVLVERKRVMHEAKANVYVFNVCVLNGAKNVRHRMMQEIIKYH